MDKETTKFDDWPLELGPHLTDAEAQTVLAFSRLYWRCFTLFFKILEATKENPSTFIWRTTILSFGGLIDSIFFRGLA